MNKLFYGGICTFSAIGAFFEIALQQQQQQQLQFFHTVIACNEMARYICMQTEKGKNILHASTLPRLIRK